MRRIGSIFELSEKINIDFFNFEYKIVKKPSKIPLLFYIGIYDNDYFLLNNYYFYTTKYDEIKNFPYVVMDLSLNLIDAFNSVLDIQFSNFKPNWVELAKIIEFMDNYGIDFFMNNQLKSLNKYLVDINKQVIKSVLKLPDFWKDFIIKFNFTIHDIGNLYKFSEADLKFLEKKFNNYNGGENKIKVILSYLSDMVAANSFTLGELFVNHINLSKNWKIKELIDQVRSLRFPNYSKKKDKILNLIKSIKMENVIHFDDKFERNEILLSKSVKSADDLVDYIRQLETNKDIIINILEEMND